MTAFEDGAADARRAAARADLLAREGVTFNVEEHTGHEQELSGYIAGVLSVLGDAARFTTSVAVGARPRVWAVWSGASGSGGVAGGPGGQGSANRGTLNVHGPATPPNDWGTLGPGHLWFAPDGADPPESPATAGWIDLGEVVPQ